MLLNVDSIFSIIFIFVFYKYYYNKANETKKTNMIQSWLSL